MNIFSVSEIKISYNPKFRYKDLKKINSSRSVFDILVNNWEDLEYVESFAVLLLNRANKVLGMTVIGKGGLSGVVADPKLIFQAALKANASGIILAHNHPSGNLLASEADKALTKKVVDAGKFLDISVLDHVIITATDYYSFADDGML